MLAISRRSLDRSSKSKFSHARLLQEDKDIYGQRGSSRADMDSPVQQSVQQLLPPCLGIFAFLAKKATRWNRRRADGRNYLATVVTTPGCLYLRRSEKTVGGW